MRHARFQATASSLLRLGALALVGGALAMVPARPVIGQQPAGQAGAPAAVSGAAKSFASPGEAVKALLAAVKSGDRAQLLTILGPGAEDVVSSGDDVADRRARERIVQASNEMSRLVKRDDNTMVLVLGKENWPMPIPLVREGKNWQFDTAQGRDEVINRRIGRNELTAIGVCGAYVDAQREYQAIDRNGDGAREYAQRVLSTTGKKDGLYWKADAGADESPMGPLVGSAVAEGYSGGNPRAGPRPYHGYLFRVLKSQGKHAQGGPMDYVKDGHMTKGFALMAWPVDYGNSGVMTFIVGQAGDVYQKDLGDETAALAGAMTAYNPDSTWTKVE